MKARFGGKGCVCVCGKKAMYVRRGIHGAEIYGDIPFLKWRERVMNFVARPPPPPPCPAHMEKNMPKKIQQSRFGKSCMCVRRHRHIHSVSGRIVRFSLPPHLRRVGAIYLTSVSQIREGWGEKMSNKSPDIGSHFTSPNGPPPSFPPPPAWVVLNRKQRAITGREGGGTYGVGGYGGEEEKSEHPKLVACSSLGMYFLYLY